MNVNLKIANSIWLASQSGMLPARKSNLLSHTKEKDAPEEIQTKDNDEEKIPDKKKHLKKHKETQEETKETDKNFSFLNYYVSGDMSSPTAILFSSEMLGSVESKVRNHEMQHLQALGKYAGAVVFGQRIGPDGESYIVSGGVKVNITEEASPEATIEKMNIIKRAAFAPGDASFRDFLLAARAVYAKQQAIMRQVMETFIEGGFNKDSVIETEA